MSSRSEEILTTIIEGNTTDIVPQCRKELFLKAIANGDTSGLPEPNCREEELLKQIAENGTGGAVENLDIELNEQDALLAELQGAVDGLQDKDIDISDATATADDIIEGKTAYTAEGKVTGTYKDMLQWKCDAQQSFYYMFSPNINYSRCFLTLEQINHICSVIDTSNILDFDYALYKTNITSVPNMDTSGATSLNSCLRESKITEYVNNFDLSNIIQMHSIMRDCRELKNVTMTNINNPNNFSISLQEAFYYCSALENANIGGTMHLSCYDTFYQCSSLKNVTINAPLDSFSGVFRYCSKLENIQGDMNFDNVKTFRYAFTNCTALTTIQVPINMIKAEDVQSMFSSCTNLTNVTLKNIKISLQIGSSSWGHLLTLDSLLNTIKELHTNTGTTTTKLTMGTSNTEKLANVYVKLIDITDEMRVEDEYIDNKAPFVQCESTDEGAMLITEYVTTVKNWQLA